MMIDSENVDSENVSDSDGESVDAELLEAIEHGCSQDAVDAARRRGRDRWPFDNDLTRVICQFVPRRYAQCACISRAFRDQREALRRAEARTALAAAVPLPVAAAIEAVLCLSARRGRYTR